MDTIPRLIEYIEKADYKIKEYQENGKTGTEFYKKLRNYREGKQLLYDRIMKRKTMWEPFGRATDENNDNCTTCGDEIFMEFLNENEENKNLEHLKYYNDLNISDKMREENKKRFRDNSKKYKTVKKLHTDATGKSYFIYYWRS